MSVTLDQIALAENTEAKFFLLPSTAVSNAVLVLIEYHKTEERDLSMYSWGNKWTLDLNLRLDPDIQFFDIARIGARNLLVAYKNPALVVLDPETRKFEPLLTIGSFFKGESRDKVSKIEVFNDLNGDGLDDVMISGFDGWQISMQHRDGSFSTPVTIGPSPMMNLGSNRYVAFTAADAYFLDHNNDGFKDLAFRADGEFLIHHQNPEGSYSRSPVAFDLGIDGISDNGDLTLSLGDEADNEKNEEKILSGFEDLNGDNVADLLIQAFEVDGLFGTKTRIDVHFGDLDSKGELTFPSTPDSVILSKGIQFGADRQDIDGNGTTEMMVVSINISLGTIIRALIAGTVSLDTGIYQMAENLYPPKPNLTRKVTATFDFSTGETSIPAIIIADVTGDGLKDLLVQENAETVGIFPGDGSSKVFSDRAISVPLTLPTWLPGVREVVQAEDLDGDKREELVMLVKIEEGPSRIVTVHFHE
ncbi:MAG: VCBS repeat-containing protein [bacterium]